MARWLKGHLRRYMIGPIVRKAFSRFLYALTLALLWNRFVNTGLVTIDYAYTILGVLFLAIAWFDYLRLDGINVPLMNLIPFNTKKRSSGAFGDMTDHLDEGGPSFDDLTQVDRDTCSLIANVSCGAIFLVLSFV